MAADVARQQIERRVRCVSSYDYTLLVRRGGLNGSHVPALTGDAAVVVAE